jgi:acyl-CoA synthetase (AMP-forming)/AMP-acid ligase II
LIRQIRKPWRIDETSRFFVPSPVTHIGGSIYAFELPFLLRSTAVLQSVWNPDDAVAIIEREACTHMAGATPFLQQLLAAARARRTRVPSLSVFICGGASVPPALIREAAGYFQNCSVSRVFGSTEFPVITVGAMQPGDIEHAAETDGEIGAAEVRVIDGNGRETQGEGEICARGPQMLVGYLWTEDERNAFDDDGYFHTGDLGRRIDTNYLAVTGRAKDIIIRQGENISPKEIEDMLSAHPDVAEVAVVGVPDARTGERACAVIVPRGSAQPDVAALRAYLDERHVARFKIPEQVELRTSLPRNMAGKVLKHKLREELIAQTAPRKSDDTLH